MKTNIASTSLLAFRQLQVLDLLQPKELEVLELMNSHQVVALTRESIAQKLGWKEASVCGRCNSLVKKGALIEIDGGKTECGRTAKLLCIPEKLEQIQAELVRKDLLERAASKLPKQKPAKQLPMFEPITV